MARDGSIAEQLTNWDKLITNVDANHVELPDLAAYRGPLDQVHEEAKALNARIQSLRGVKQQERVELRELMRSGRFLASKLRAALKAVYGYQNERLLEYGIRPIRSRKKPPTEPEPPPQPEVTQVEAAAETAKAPKLEDPAPAPPKAASQES